MFFIPFEKREEYYQSLDIADKGEYKEYISRMLQLIIDQIRSYRHNKQLYKPLFIDNFMVNEYKTADNGYNSGKDMYAKYSNASVSSGSCPRHKDILPVPNCPHCNPQ